MRASSQILAKNNLTILITGANGLLGRVFAKYLKTLGHNIIGIDHTPQHTVSTRFLRDGAEKSTLLQEAFFGEYYLADVTEKDKVEEIISRIDKIDIVIHLAAVMEGEEASLIEHVNNEGTKNIFELCKKYDIKQIIYASSIMTILDKLLNEEPYCHINMGDYQGILSEIPKISVSCRAMPPNASDSVRAYINSKFHGETIGKEYVQHAISTVSLRFGAISAMNIPYDEKKLLPIWCSHEDACRFVQCVIEKLQSTLQPFSQTYYVCSQHKFSCVDLENDLGFSPLDDSSAILLAHQATAKEGTVVSFSVFKPSASDPGDGEKIVIYHLS